MTTDRIVARAPATLSHWFSAAGAAGVSVTATDDAGDLVLDGVAAAAVMDGETPTGRWTVAVPAAAVPAPTALTVEWDAGDGWVETDYVEVAGGRYTTAAELRSGATADRGLGRTDRVTDELLEAAIVVVERRIEKATHVAWVPRFLRTTVRSDGAVVMLPPMVREVLELTVAGNSLDPEYLDMAPSGIGRLTRSGREGPVEIALLHGHQAPPADLREAAIDAAKMLAATEASKRVAPARTESMSAGGYSFNFAEQASLKHGRPFGSPDIDAVVMSHESPVPAVA